LRIFMCMVRREMSVLMYRNVIAAYIDSGRWKLASWPTIIRRIHQNVRLCIIGYVCPKDFAYLVTVACDHQTVNPIIVKSTAKYSVGVCFWNFCKLPKLIKTLRQIGISVLLVRTVICSALMNIARLASYRINH